MSRTIQSGVLRLLLVASLGTAALPLAAYAQDPNAAACFAAREEMKRLATKNAWAGVERKYEELLKLSCETIKFDDHFLGAQAAKYQGKTYEMYERLVRAKDVEAKPDVVAEIEAIETRYGRVDIQGTFKVLPTLDVVMPFSPDERKSIEWAQKVLLETGSFKGMLPIDIEYKLNGAGNIVPFTPKAGPDWLAMDLGSAGKWRAAASGEVATPPDGPPDGTPDGTPDGPKPDPGIQGPIDTAGPIVLVGFNYLSSSQPADPCLVDPFPDTPQNEACDFSEGEGDYRPATPGDFGGAGFGAELGAEVVFTGKKFAASGTVAYGGAFAPPDVAHSFRGWLAGSFRPGDARISVGPTYGVVMATGRGLATWYNQSPDQDQTAYPNAELPYGGTSTTAGLQLTAGYGFLDLGDSLMLLGEAGGSWSTDGTRSYVNAGARVGVVPRIKRFKG